VPPFELAFVQSVGMLIEKLEDLARGLTYRRIDLNYSRQAKQCSELPSARRVTWGSEKGMKNLTLGWHKTWKCLDGGFEQWCAHNGTDDA